jgi:type 1 glutamine amidotransferase
MRTGNRTVRPAPVKVSRDRAPPADFLATAAGAGQSGLWSRLGKPWLPCRWWSGEIAFHACHIAQHRDIGETSFAIATRAHSEQPFAPPPMQPRSLASSCARRAILLAFCCVASLCAADKKVLLIAGRPSHPAGAHEHNAGVLLLQKCLAGVPGLRTEVSLGVWPSDPATLNNADAIFIYGDGAKNHIALQEDRLEKLDTVLSRGAGFGVLHFAVEPTLEKGQKEFLSWLGGAFEIHWSVNPHWDPAFTSLPTHPITRGVKPFTVRDEWYFHMRFVEGMRGVTPILVAVPDAKTMSRPDGAHSGNPHVRTAVARAEPQIVAWAYERPNGGRGFGFTGGHFHKNWGNDDFRKIVLNAVLWLAKMEVPPDGVASQVTPSDLAVNLDLKPVWTPIRDEKKKSEQTPK